MHELGIAHSILDALANEGRKHPDSRITKVGLRIGRVSGVDPEALRFSFEVISAESDLGPVVMEIEEIPIVRRCRTCSREFECTEPHAACPDCGDLFSHIIAGDDLAIEYVEVDEQ